jgi:hypothetical protein
MNKVIALSVLAVFGACSQQQGSPTEVKEGLVINQHDQTTIDLTYRSAAQSVHVTAVESSSKVVDITFDFGANVIAYHLDYAAGEGDFMNSGLPFDAAEILVVGQMLKTLPSILPSDENQFTAVENATIRQTNLLSEAPVGQNVAAFHFVADRGWTYIGCGCSSQYDGHDGNHVGGTGCGCTGGSGNGCKGRCGGGCTQDGASINAYTRDCLCHDYNMCSWTTASDDFSFAGSNCGATGGCY